MRIRTSVWIEDANGEAVYGLGRHRALLAIRDLGSIQAAAEQMGISYRGLWGRIRTSERRLGFPLVESRPGRGSHAGTRITPRGALLIQAYDSALQSIFSASEQEFTERLRPVLTESPPD
jgi:molybdate transport system regulatory protein